tara:strand:- start:461 stop:1051 length:591 start_codon:yes stop_codon:yes gene_type:complete
VIEALFKKNILILVLLSIIYTNNYNSHIINNILPYELSKNSIGIQILNDSNQKMYTFFNHQAWISENLFIDNYLSYLFDNNIDITYGFNLGYGSAFEKQHFKNIIYCIGYHRKKYSEYTYKSSSFSINSIIKLNKNWLSLNSNYFFNNSGNNKIDNYLSFKYIVSLRNKFIFNTGIQLNINNSKEINYLIGFNYSL